MWKLLRLLSLTERYLFERRAIDGSGLRAPTTASRDLPCFGHRHKFWVTDPLVKDGTILELGDCLLAGDFKRCESPCLDIATRRDPWPREQIDDLLPLAGLFNKASNRRGEVHRLVRHIAIPEACRCLAYGLATHGGKRLLVGQQQHLGVRCALREPRDHR